MIVWVQHIACMRVGRNVYNVLVKKPEQKRPFGRPKQVSDYNINTLAP